MPDITPTELLIAEVKQLRSELGELRDEQADTKDKTNKVYYKMFGVNGTPGTFAKIDAMAARLDELATFKTVLETRQKSMNRFVTPAISAVVTLIVGLLFNFFMNGG